MKKRLFLTVVSIVTVTGVPDDRVRFPGLNYPDEEETRTNRGIEPCFQNQAFCEFSSDYPRNVNIDSNLVQNTLIKAKIFDSGRGDNSDFQSLINSKRFGFAKSEKVRACRVIRRQIFPTKARNVRGEYLFIVNDGQYTQSVEIEQCQDEGASCLTDQDAPFSGTTECRQKYATHKLYAISGLKQMFEHQNFL